MWTIIVAHFAYPLYQRNIEGFYADSGLDDAVNEFATLGRQEFAETGGFDQLAVYSNVSKKPVNLKL
jgi:hypothetical protein